MRLVNKHSISPLHTSYTLTSKTFVQTHPDSSLCLCLCPSLWLTVIFISYWRTVLTLSMRCCCAISEAYTDTDILSEQQGEENLRLMDVIFHDHLFCPLSSSLWICPPFTLSNSYSVYFSVLVHCQHRCTIQESWSLYIPIIEMQTVTYILDRWVFPNL